VGTLWWQKPNRDGVNGGEEQKNNGGEEQKNNGGEEQKNICNTVVLSSESSN
jgi:hypothetical protein